MRKFRDKRGVTIAPVIVFVVLWILTTTFFLIFHVKWQEQEQAIRNNDTRIKTITKSVKVPLETRKKKIENLVGFFDEGGVNVNITKLIDNLNKINNGKDDSYGTKKYYGLVGISGSALKEDSLTSIDSTVNLETVLAAFEARVLELQRKEATLANTINKIKDDRESKDREYNEVKTNQTKILEALDREHNDLRDKFERLVNRVKEQKRKADELRSKAEEKRSELEKNLQSEKLDFDNQIIKQKSNIRRIQAKKYGNVDVSKISEKRLFDPSEEIPDGKVVFGDPRSNSIYIDLGKKSGVFKGLKFDVYRKAKRGNREFKGRVEIRRVLDQMSTAVVINNRNKYDPIVGGDLLVNPIFSEDGKIHMTFAGRFNKLTLNKAADLASQIGGKVEVDVSARTNFVVVGERKGEEHKNYLAAVKFKIPLMSESTFVNYLSD